jgi:hypothetical protein
VVPPYYKPNTIRRYYLLMFKAGLVTYTDFAQGSYIFSVEFVFVVSMSGLRCTNRLGVSISVFYYFVFTFA